MAMSAVELMVAALSGKRVGKGWMACCPAHDDRVPSLSIDVTEDGSVLLYCHAGCTQTSVVEAIRSRGLWSRDLIPRIEPMRRNECSDFDRSRVALGIWEASRPAASSPAEAYLHTRGLALPETDTLRCHGGLKHPSGATWPAMIALVERGDDGLPVAIHRTFLAFDGKGKAPIVPAKMMLGPCRGGAVRLAAAGSSVMVGEGIETCLAAMLATKRPAWAALSTSGLKSLQLPLTIEDVVVLADGDDPGEAAAVHCARQWVREGRRVRIARPPRGTDFADLLGGALPSIGEAMS
jgi:putative DNA primase/helicase